MIKVECDACKAPYQIDEKRVPATGLKMRCPKCGNSLLVMKPGAAPPPPAPAAPAGGPADLPAAVRTKPGPPPRPGPKAGTLPFGAVDLAPGPADLPAVPAPRPPPAPPRQGGRTAPGFGEIDLMVDLPAPSPDSAAAPQMPSFGDAPPAPYAATQPAYPPPQAYAPPPASVCPAARVRRAECRSADAARRAR